MEILGKSILVMKAQSDVVLEFLYVTVSTGGKSPDLFDVPHRILCGTPKAHVRWERLCVARLPCEVTFDAISASSLCERASEPECERG